MTALGVSVLGLSSPISSLSVATLGLLGGSLPDFVAPPATESVIYVADGFMFEPALASGGLSAATLTHSIAYAQAMADGGASGQATAAGGSGRLNPADDASGVTTTSNSNSKTSAD